MKFLVVFSLLVAFLNIFLYWETQELLHLIVAIPVVMASILLRKEE
jgi:hypothetical protein